MNGKKTHTGGRLFLALLGLGATQLACNAAREFEQYADNGRPAASSEADAETVIGWSDDNQASHELDYRIAAGVVRRNEQVLSAIEDVFRREYSIPDDCDVDLSDIAHVEAEDSTNRLIINHYKPNCGGCTDLTDPDIFYLGEEEMDVFLRAIDAKNSDYFRYTSGTNLAESLEAKGEDLSRILNVIGGSEQEEVLILGSEETVLVYHPTNPLFVLVNRYMDQVTGESVVEHIPIGLTKIQYDSIENTLEEIMGGYR